MYRYLSIFIFLGKDVTSVKDLKGKNVNGVDSDSGLIKEPVDKGDLIDESFAVKAAEETK